MPKDINNSSSDETNATTLQYIWYICWKSDIKNERICLLPVLTNSK